MKLEQAMSQDPSLEESAPDEERHASNRISLRLCRCLVAQACPNLYNPMAWTARLLCPWDSPGMNTGVGCHFLLQGSSQPRDQTGVSCIDKWILNRSGTWEAQFFALPFQNKGVDAFFTSPFISSTLYQKPLNKAHCWAFLVAQW